MCPVMACVTQFHSHPRFHLHSGKQKKAELNLLDSYGAVSASATACDRSKLTLRCIAELSG